MKAKNTMRNALETADFLWHVSAYSDDDETKKQAHGALGQLISAMRTRKGTVAGIPESPEIALNELKNLQVRYQKNKTVKEIFEELEI